MYRKIIFTAIIIILLIPSNIKGSGLLEKIEVYRGNIKIAVNNTPVELEEQPFIYNNRVYVPLRFISDALGEKVEWIPESRAVIIKELDLNVSLDDCQPEMGEIFVYGKILNIDYENYRIEIEQHFDDNSIEISPFLSVSRHVVVMLQGNDEKNIHFFQLRKGDTGGFILDSSGRVRGIIVSS